jgi:hypothetical protein
MARMISVGGGNFRPPDYAHFEWVCSIPPNKKQVSPFIVLQPGEVRAVDNVFNLLNSGIPEDTEILHTWPGKYRSDVFRFTIHDLNEWRKL